MSVGWRTYTGPHGHALTIKPDAFVLLADVDWEHRWFLEIDRATEHRPSILRKANEYVSYWRSGTEQNTNEIFPKVLWIAPDEARAAHLTDWLGQLDPLTWQLFQVCTDAGFATAIRSAFQSEGAP